VVEQLVRRLEEAVVRDGVDELDRVRPERRLVASREREVLAVAMSCRTTPSTVSTQRSPSQRSPNVNRLAGVTAMRSCVP
jgi:hypothetical protein